MRIVIGSGNHRHEFTRPASRGEERERFDEDVKNFVTRPALFKAQHTTGGHNGRSL